MRSSLSHRVVRGEGVWRRLDGRGLERKAQKAFQRLRLIEDTLHRVTQRNGFELISGGYVKPQELPDPPERSRREKP